MINNVAVDIAAGGEGSRLRERMNALGYLPNFPKHLLATGGDSGETLIGRIVRQCLSEGIPPIIHANAKNAPYISTHADVDRQAQTITATYASAFGPFICGLVNGERRILGATGDHYADGFSWSDLINHHDSSPFPATVVVSAAPPLNKGAVFDIASDGQVTNFRRPERTQPDDRINIGLYVFDPHPTVLHVLGELGITAQSTPGSMGVSPEEIVTALIGQGLVGAYELPRAFNINDAEAYQRLLRHTQQAAPA